MTEENQEYSHNQETIEGELEEVEAITSLEATQSRLNEVSRSELETPFARRSAEKIAQAIGAGIATYRRNRAIPELSDEHRAILAAEANAGIETAAYAMAPAYRWLIESCGLGPTDRAILTLYRGALPEDEDRQIALALAQSELRTPHVQGITHRADLQEIAKISARLRSNLGHIDFAERIAQAVDNLYTAVKRQRQRIGVGQVS